MKYKLLIAMALDAANGAVDGVKVPCNPGNAGRSNKRRDYGSNKSNPVYFWSRKRLHSCKCPE